MAAQEVPSTIVTTNLDIVNNSDNLTSLREAITHAGTGTCGNAITFNLPSSCSNTINLTGSIALSGDTCIVDGTNLGANGGRIRLVAGSNSRIFYMHAYAHLTLQNIVLAHGYQTNLSGGGILNNNATLIARNCQFDTNFSGFNGGAISSRGTASRQAVLCLENCTFRGNVATATASQQYGGAAIYCIRTDAIIKSCSFIQNEGHWGGAVKLELSSVEIDSCSFLHNTSLNRGGALETVNSYTTIRNTSFDSNSIPSNPSPLPNTLLGGAVFSMDTASIISGCRFASCLCGGILVWSYTFISCSKVSNKCSDSTGLLRCAFMPAWSDLCTSSSKAFAVRAMIGISFASALSRLRIISVASSPFITGMRTSIRIALYSPTALCRNISTAICPFSA
jgi:hypothetical protein